MEQELGERMRAWRRAHPKATLYEVEGELDAQIAVLRAQMLAETAAAGAGGEDGEKGAAEAAAVCPVCQGQLVKDGQRQRKLKNQRGSGGGVGASVHALSPVWVRRFPPG